MLDQSVVISLIVIAALICALSFAKHYNAWPFKKKPVKKQEAPALPPPTKWDYIKQININAHGTDKVYSFPSENEFGVERDYLHNLLYIFQVTQIYPEKKRNIIAELDPKHYSIIHVKRGKYPEEKKESVADLMSKK